MSLTFLLSGRSSTVIEVPVINAGSGKSEHLSQSLLDYFTIKESFNGQVENLKIGFIGDCLRGRIVHSLAKILLLMELSEFLFLLQNLL